MNRLLLLTLLLFATIAKGQTVSTAFPSLQLPVDARSASLAGATTALSADISSVNANPARLALINAKHTVSFDYLPFRAIADDAKKMAMKYALVMDRRSSVAASVYYYTPGLINLRNDLGATTAQVKHNEYFVTLSYGRQLGNYSYLGASLRYLNQSNLINPDDNTVITGGSAVGADLGFLYSAPLRSDFENLKIGASLTNIGSKLQGLYQPMNLSIGATYSSGYYDADPYSMLPVAFLAGLQFDKPLVPAMPIYDASGQIIAGKNPQRSVLGNLFSTWNDAPGGFKQNLRQFRSAVYSEVVFEKYISVRAGYTYEDPAYGGRTFLSTGAGVQWDWQDSEYSLNISYTQPIGKNASISPLRNAFSLQMIIQFGQ